MRRGRGLAPHRGGTAMARRSWSPVALLRQRRWSRWLRQATSCGSQWCPDPALRGVCSPRGCVRALRRRQFASHRILSSDRAAAVTMAPRIRRHLSDEQGSATVVILGVIAAVLMLTISGLFLASAVLASHRARAAADLAALASAGVLMRGEPPAAA